MANAPWSYARHNERQVYDEHDSIHRQSTLADERPRHALSAQCGLSRSHSARERTHVHPSLHNTLSTARLGGADYEHSLPGQLNSSAQLAGTRSNELHNETLTASFQPRPHIYLTPPVAHAVPGQHVRTLPKPPSQPAGKHSLQHCSGALPNVGRRQSDQALLHPSYSSRWYAAPAAFSTPQHSTLPQHSATSADFPSPLRSRTVSCRARALPPFHLFETGEEDCFEAETPSSAPPPEAQRLSPRQSPAAQRRSHSVYGSRHISSMNNNMQGVEWRPRHKASVPSRLMTRDSVEASQPAAPYGDAHYAYARARQRSGSYQAEFSTGSPENYRRNRDRAPSQHLLPHYGMADRQTTARRRLPDVPTRQVQTPSSGSSSPGGSSPGGRQLPVPFRRLGQAGRLNYPNGYGNERDFTEAIRIECAKSYHEHDDDAETPQARTPPPVIRRDRQPSNKGTPGYQPHLHMKRSIRRRGSKGKSTLAPLQHASYCNRRGSMQSLEQYVDTACTCVDLTTTAEHSSSENVESKSSTPCSDMQQEYSTQQRSEELPETDSGLSESIPEVSKSPDESPSCQSIAAEAEQEDEGADETPKEDSPPPARTVIEDDSADDNGAMGKLKLAVQYFPVRKRLRVNLVKAEDLLAGLRPDKDLNSSFRICLQPGDIEVQQSRVVHKNRTASFCEEFFFNNLAQDEVFEKTLYIELCHDEGGKGKIEIIGELRMPLSKIDGLMTRKEVRLVRGIHPKFNVKKYGKIHITTCLDKQATRFTITVVKVDDIPKYPITGTPDPYVRISLDQSGCVQRKQTRHIKNTCSPTYKEGISFLMSTAPSVLETTKLVISVHDYARLDTDDDVIAQCFLGELGTDKSEHDQWKNTMSHPGKEVKATHTLKRLDYPVEL